MGGQEEGYVPGARQAKAPPILNENNTYSEFLRWKRMWNSYLKLSRIAESKPFVQRETLYTFLSLGFQDLLVFHIGIPEETEMTVTEIVDRIQTYLRGQHNVLHDRMAFHERVQKEGEPFHSFVADVRRLHKLAGICSHCRLDDCIDVPIFDRILVGMSNDEARKNIMKMVPTPTLSLIHI